MTKKISVIIAARNEEKRIGNVLGPLSNHPLVDDVVVMCDDCSDKTADIARKFNAHVIEHKKRNGKTIAIKRGLEYAKNEHVMLLDADLKGLTKQNIIDLATPVLTGQVDFTLSIRKNSYRFYKWLGIDFVSGERVMHKSLLLDPLIWSKPKLIFSLEVLMNESLLKRSCTFLPIYLPNLYATPKSEKRGFVKGTIEDILMDIDILVSLSPTRVLGQMIKMSILAKKYRKQINEKTEALA